MVKNVKRNHPKKQEMVNEISQLRLAPGRNKHGAQNFCFFISFNANKKPTANNIVISPAKYGISSVIFFIVNEF